MKQFYKWLDDGYSFWSWLTSWLIAFFISLSIGVGLIKLFNL